MVAHHREIVSHCRREQRYREAGGCFGVSSDPCQTRPLYVYSQHESHIDGDDTPCDGNRGFEAGDADQRDHEHSDETQHT